MKAAHRLALQMIDQNVDQVNHPKRESKVFSFILLLLVSAYRVFGSLFVGGACRFEPSCSEYASDALRNHGPFAALRLIALRLAKCRPGGAWGFDPVPDREIVRAPFAVRRSRVK